MLKSTVSKALWVGRATSAVVGLAIVLALVVGVASAAVGANGQNFILGQLNKATAKTQLNGNVSGGPALQVNNTNTNAGSRALQLGVAQNKPPIVVNASAGKAANLNADEVDGNDSSEIGINGLERVFKSSALNSDSPKSANASCPLGKVVIGTGFHMNDGKRIVSGNQEETDLLIDDLVAGETSVNVIVYEEEPTEASWSVVAQAICARAP